MEHFSFPQRTEKRPLDSSPAVVVIDRDVTVFVLKLLDKTNIHKSSRVQMGRRRLGRKKGRAQRKLYGSNYGNSSSGSLQHPGRIRLEVLKPVDGDFIHLTFMYLADAFISNNRCFSLCPSLAYHYAFTAHCYSLFNMNCMVHNSVLFSLNMPWSLFDLHHRSV